MSAHRLMPIPDLFARSWERVIRHFGKLCILSIYALITFIFFSLLFIGFFTVTGLMQALTWFWYLPFVASLSMLTLILVSCVAIYMIMSVFRSSALYILAEEGHGPPVRKSVNRGLLMVIPVFVANVLIVFLVIGGGILLFFPALVVGFYLMFTQLVVLFEGKKPRLALKTSAGYVSQFAGALFVRLIVFIFLVAVLCILIIPAIRQIFAGSPISYIITMLINFMFQFFSLSFALTLYQDVKAKYNPDHHAKSHWIWFISVIGWIVAGLIVLATTHLR